MRQARGRAGRAGFTVMELMIAMVIIGVMAATIAPSLTGVLSDNRQNAAMMDALRLARKARNLAMSSGVAHLIRYQAAGANGLGTIGLFVGMNNRCAQTPWATAFAAASAQNQGAIETLDMSFYNPTAGTAPAKTDMGRYVIFLVMEGGPLVETKNEVQLCYQPSGESYMRFATVDAMVRQTSMAKLKIRRTYDGISNTQGRDREIMLTPGATPWVN